MPAAAISVSSEVTSVRSTFLRQLQENDRGITVIEDMASATSTVKGASVSSKSLHSLGNPRRNVVRERKTFLAEQYDQFTQANGRQP